MLIDIASESVGGACSIRESGKQPKIVYLNRIKIDPHSGEPIERAMLRSLTSLGELLIKEGAPALLRALGSGSVSSVIVSVDAPWQRTSIRQEHFEGDQPFTFTKSLVEKTMKKVGCAVAGKVVCDESVVGSLLNGYETKEPYGKKAHRAEAIIMSSQIDQSVVGNVTAVLRGMYHTRRIKLISGCSLRHQALRDAFPHEHNALILDASGSLVSIELIRDSILVAISEVPDGSVGDAKWATEVKQGLSELAKDHPLPRNIFIIARDGEISEALKSLANTDLGSLWLSDNPPNLMSISASHLSAHVKQSDSGAIADIPLLLMALYAHEREPD